MIVTITINPAIDKSTTTEKLVPDKKLRCSNMVIEAGGGGINVSKAIWELGGQSLALFPSGGMNGKLIEKYFEKRGIHFKAIPLEEETRENIMVCESISNAQYRFIMPGPTLSQKEANQCFELIKSLSPVPTIIVASGSLAPGLPDTFFQELASLSKALNAKLFVDTSGRPLQLAANKGVFLLKPNLTELCGLSGKEHLELDEVDDAAFEIIRKGHCDVIVVSMGPSGAILVTRDGSQHIPAPSVKKLSTVGAGDSMVAGMAWMLEQGKSLIDMARFGVACGTAATMNAGTQLFKKDDVFKLYHWINEYPVKYKINTPA